MAPFQNTPARPLSVGSAVPWATASRWALVCGLFFAAACVTDGAPDGSASADRLAPGKPQGEPPLDLLGDAPWPAPYAADPVWVRASRGDDLERARLARRESAGSLLEAVEQGGSLARVALSSLAYASDRRSARGALCGLLARTDESSRPPLLAALMDAVTDAPHTEESIDPAADALCAASLQALARNGSVSPADRDRAAAVLAQLRPR
jgi:hypothetical protein